MPAVEVNGVETKPRPRGGRPRQYPPIEDFRALKDEVRVLRESMSVQTVTESAAAAVPAGGGGGGLTELDRTWQMLSSMAQGLGWQAFNDGMLLQMFNNVGRMYAVADWCAANRTRLAEAARDDLARRGCLGPQTPA